LGDPAGLQGAKGGQPEGDAQREGELTVGEQGHHTGGEPQRRPARRLSPAVADEAVEEVGGGDHGDRADELRADQRREGREEDAVGEGVVAAVPAAVPDREPSVLEELGAEDLRREVSDLGIPGEHQGRERGAEPDRGKPVGAESLGLDHGGEKG
jgi:hypothetical protein